MLCGQWEPTPPRAGSLDDANARGFDTDSVRHDHATPQPLDDVWQAALDGAVEQARHLREDDRRCEYCTEGIRCAVCDERICEEYGPEPRACSTVCADCPCDCQGCLDHRADMRADLLHQIERESR